VDGDAVKVALEATLSPAKSVMVWELRVMFRPAGEVAPIESAMVPEKPF